jgi:hypothetical protein
MGACLSSGSDPVSDPHSRERERYNRELEETANTLRVRAATRGHRAMLPPRETVVVVDMHA